MLPLTAALAIMLNALPHAADTAARLSSEEVQRILDACNSNVGPCPTGLTARQGFVAIVWASINGPRQRVAFLAREAKREYKKLSANDISEDGIAPTISVRAMASRPEKVNDRVHDVEHVFLRPKGAPKDSVIRPVTEVPVEETLRNGFGATTTVHDLVASFNSADVPKGDFEIVVLVEGWREQTIQVKAKDMMRVQ